MNKEICKCKGKGGVILGPLQLVDLALFYSFKKEMLSSLSLAVSKVAMK